MRDLGIQRPAWKDVLKQHRFLALPAAHNALAARMIERAGFPAYQIGGFALVGATHAVPDIDLEHFGEISEMVERIIPACRLPVLVDGDNGYGDVKNVTRTVKGYEFLGASAIFLEDQVSPKKCGHMAGKKVVPVDEAVKNVRAAVDAKSKPEFFILARTDAIAPHGLDDALMRGEQYLKAGADGVYFEGPTTEDQLKIIGENFRHVPLCTSVLEHGGVTPALSQKEFQDLGFNMVLYPSTLLFQVAKTMQSALETLRDGKLSPQSKAVDMEEWLEIVDMPHWKQIEEGHESGPNQADR